LEIRLKKNVFLKSIEAVVTISASFTQLAVITQNYAPAIVGDYQLVLAWLFLVSALSCFGGIIMISTRELSQGSDSERSAIYSSAFFLQVLVAIPLCAVALCAFSFFLPQFVIALTIGTIASLGGTILQLSQALLVSKEKISKVVAASIIGQVMTTGLLCFAAYHKCSLSNLVAAWATCNVVQGIVLFFQSRAWQVISLQLIRPSLIKKLAVECLPVLVMVLATHLYVRIDIIMLSYFTNTVVVAQYSAGYLFLDQLMILSNFMMGALFPNFARSSLEGGSEYRLLYTGILKLFCKYLVPIALLIALSSKQLLGIIYGPDYAMAWLSLSILMIAAVFAWINGPSGTIFISLRKQHIYMWATVFSLLVNIVGNLIMIPIIGAIGAAISTVLTELAICCFSLYWIHRETGYLPWMRPSAN
jgi:O-antigen/teichoic acid export membrane protein